MPTREIFRPRYLIVAMGGHGVPALKPHGAGAGYRPSPLAGADVFRMREGFVGRKCTYLDWLAYQRQVGIDPVATLEGHGR